MNTLSEFDKDKQAICVNHNILCGVSAGSGSCIRQPYRLSRSKDSEGVRLDILQLRSALLAQSEGILGTGVPLEPSDTQSHRRNTLAWWNRQLRINQIKSDALRWRFQDTDSWNA